MARSQRRCSTAMRRRMRPDDMLETFSELARNEPDLIRLLLQASVAVLVNVQSLKPGAAEMTRDEQNSYGRVTPKTL